LPRCLYSEARIILGVLGLASTEERDFGRQAAFLWAVAAEVAIGLQNALLHQEVQGHVVELEKEVSQRKKAEDARRISEERFRNIFEHSPIGIYQTTPDGRILMANPTLVHMLGCSSFAELAQRDLQNPGHFADCSRADFMQRVERDDQVIGFEAAWTRQDGSLLLVYENARVVRDEQGNVLYYEGTAEDITERVRAEQERERLMKEIQEQAHSVQQIMDTVPEGVILLDDVGQVRLANPLQQAQHAARLIQQILDFSRRSVVERQPFDLLPLFKEHVRLLERTLSEDIEIKLDYGADEYTANADPTRMQQMLTNLALNARDAMPDGGTLRIGLERICIAKHGPAPLPEMAAGDWLRIEVSDTGTGICPDALAHLFEPFFTTKEPGKGTGLGLSQVHGIVGAHEGHIDVASWLNYGTTFTIYLPALSTSVSEQADQDMRDLVRERERPSWSLRITWLREMPWWRVSERSTITCWLPIMVRPH